MENHNPYRSFHNMKRLIRQNIVECFDNSFAPVLFIKQIYIWVRLIGQKYFEINYFEINYFMITILFSVDIFELRIFKKQPLNLYDYEVVIRTTYISSLTEYLVVIPFSMLHKLNIMIQNKLFCNLISIKQSNRLILKLILRLVIPYLSYQTQPLGVVSCDI